MIEMAYFYFVRNEQTSETKSPIGCVKCCALIIANFALKSQQQNKSEKKTNEPTAI